MADQAPKRFTGTTTVDPELYTSQKGKVVKQYLEQNALGNWAAATPGVQNAGSVYVTSVTMDLLHFISISRLHTFPTEVLVTQVVPIQPSLSTLMSK